MAVASHTRMKEVDSTVERLARWLARRIQERGPDTPVGPKRSMRSKDREFYDLALAHAVRMAWVEIDEESIRLGSAVPV